MAGLFFIVSVLLMVLGFAYNFWLGCLSLLLVWYASTRKGCTDFTLALGCIVQTLIAGIAIGIAYWLMNGFMS